VNKQLSAARILLGSALLCAVADALCTLAGLRPMTAAISGSLPDASHDPALVVVLGALCAACRLAFLLLAPAFVIAAALLTAYNALAQVARQRLAQDGRDAAAR
jgi:hypothetical protein